MLLSGRVRLDDEFPSTSKVKDLTTNPERWEEKQ